MSKLHSLTVENNSDKRGDICIFQTVPHVDSLLPIAWFTKPLHPETTVEFDWKTEYSFVWHDSGNIVPNNAFKASNPSDFYNAGPHSTTDSGGACMESAGSNYSFKPHPRYWVAFGDYKEGDIIDPSRLKNAVELKPEDLGKKIIINKDHSISIE